MTIHLSAEQSAQWNDGGWLSLEVQETVLEDLDRQQCTELVLVCTSDGTVIFAVVGGGVA